MSAKEIPMKQWLADEAERNGISAAGIGQRLRYGHYDGAVSVRRVNPRVVWVTWLCAPPPPRGSCRAKV